MRQVKKCSDATYIGFSPRFAPLLKCRSRSTALKNLECIGSACCAGRAPQSRRTCRARLVVALVLRPERDRPPEGRDQATNRHYSLVLEVTPYRQRTSLKST